MKEIKLYKSPLLAVLLFLMCLAFVLMSIFIIHHNLFIKWLGILFFGLGAFISLIIIFDRTPQMIINQKGIWYKKAIWTKYNADDIIEWQTINQIYWSAINNQKFICLDLLQSQPKKQNTFQKSFAKLNKSMGFEETNLPLSLIKIDADKLVDFLASMTVSNETQREYLIKNFIIPRPKSFFSKFKF